MRKQLHVLCVMVLSIMLGSPLCAQSSKKVNHSVQIRILSVDYSTLNTSLKTESSLFVPNGVEFSYTNTINDRFAFSLPVKYHRANISENQVSKSVYSADALAKYLIYKDERKLNPYLLLGGGLVYEEDASTHVQLPAGLGLNYMIGSHSMLNLETQYRYSMIEQRNNLQIALGVSFSVGKVVEEDLASDPLEMTAEDVVMDLEEEDEMPKPVFVDQRSVIETELASDDNDEAEELVEETTSEDELIEEEVYLEEDIDEVPVDTDEDGVVDELDECPTMPGPASKKGCPIQDKDKDGIEDFEDACPEVAGLKVLGGCPDSDGDGIKDSEDACPEVAGTINGCPDGDDDNDGIPNSLDKCPSMAGDADHLGCPEMEKEEKSMLKLAADNIQFEFGKAHLKSISYQTLDQIAELLKKYPEFELEIVGHTDDVGRKQSNLELSLDRATSCRDYLISRKIDANRIKVLAEGELKPVGTNTTEAGREKNRRVEFNIIGQ